MRLIVVNIFFKIFGFANVCEWEVGVGVVCLNSCAIQTNFQCARLQGHFFGFKRNVLALRF